MIQFGIMGAGNIARKFADAVRQVEGAQVAAVDSKSLERAQAFAQEQHIPAGYGGYQGMLQRPDIDAVYIATTNNFHYENILQCLEHGKHVLCEKSMVLHTRQAEEVFALAREKGLFLMECMWVRFLPKIQKVKEWVETGRIGKLKCAQGNLGFYAGKDLTTRAYNPALGGGSMYDLGVYLIEVLGYFATEPLTQVESTVVRAPPAWTKPPVSFSATGTTWWTASAPWARPCRKTAACTGRRATSPCGSGSTPGAGWSCTTSPAGWWRSTSRRTSTALSTRCGRLCAV